jgi:DNA damage-inducible protein 1
MICRHVTIHITASAGDTTWDDQLLTLEIMPQTTLDDLKQQIAAESGILKEKQQIFFNAMLLVEPSKTMEDYSLGESDMLFLQVGEPRPKGIIRPSNPPLGSGNRQDRLLQSENSDTELIRMHILGNPALRSEVHRSRPELGTALENPSQFAHAYHQMQLQAQREQLSRQQMIEALNADPFDIEAQTKIAEMIRTERVNENLQNAMEHNPESLSSTVPKLVPF